MHYEILDKKRLAVLPLLGRLKKDFYLAGGTGLALQLGHRDSVDFDFFTPKDFDAKVLFDKLKIIFKNYKILKIQEEKNTLTILLDRQIKISFFTYNYKLVDKIINEKYLRLASEADIACMKLSAIVSRSTNKDYIDLYYLAQKIPLKKMLKLAAKKMPDLDTNLILKSLVYFVDINTEAIKFKNKHKVGLKNIEQYFKKEVRALGQN